VLDGGQDGDARTGLELPAPTSVRAPARAALPDTGSGAADAGLTAVGAEVLLALEGFDTLHALTEGVTVTGTVTTGDADLLRALGHFDMGECV